MTQTIRFLKPSDLRSTARGLAVMSLLFDPERRCRFWNDPALSADLASWRDGKGGSAGFVFLPRATVVLGADRDSPMCPLARPDDPQYWPGIFDDLPAELRDLLNRQPLGDAYPMEETTFCLWNMGKGLDWKKGKVEYPRREPPGDPDGAKYTLGRLKEYFDHFDTEMNEEFSQKFDGDTLYQVFSGEAVSPEDLRRLKSSVDLAEVRDALKEMGIRV